jgi:hypothetical protein
MSVNSLNDISKVYLEQVAESAVPGKPAERLGAVTAIPKSEQDAARKRLLAKTKAKREKMKEENEIEEAVRGVDSGIRRAASAERRSGDRRLSPSTGRGYADQQQQSISYMDNLTKKNKNVVGLVTKEALDPVGQEDADIDNDGDTDKSDKYLHNRRKAIDKAIAKNRGKDVKEGFSNWRQDLAEVMTDDENDVKIKEKKVNNKIKINPKLGEAVEEIGGTLLEMVEIDEVDYIVESVYDELLEEGYEEDDIEEALEYALIEAKVTFGHDTDKPYQKKTGAGQMVRAVGRLARQKLASKVAGARKSTSSAVARGARKVAKGALSVARKMEGGDKAPKITERKPSTYRGAGAGTKEKVSSGSYTPPNQKKAAKPADPWEGSYKKSSEVETKAPKSKPKSAVKSKPSTTQKGKKKSKLDDLLTSIRNEETVIDEKMNLAKAKMGDVIKDFYKSKAPQFKGVSKEKRRQMAVAAKLTAERGGKKLGEQMLDEPSNDLSNKKELLDKQKISNLKMLQQKKQMMDRQRLQMQKTGKLPLDTASYEPEGEVIDERRKEDKVAGTPRKPRNLAFELVAKSMGTGRMGVKPRGEKKVPGKKPPAAGEYGATASPAQKVAKRRAARKSAQDNMSSRFD